MSNEIEKNNGKFSLKIKNGTLEHTIDGFTKDEMIALRDAIDNALKEEPKPKKRIWNPRSKRHEWSEED